jgi:hypothetical protein
MIQSCSVKTLSRACDNESLALLAVDSGNLCTRSDAVLGMVIQFGAQAGSLYPQSSCVQMVETHLVSVCDNSEEADG